MSNDTDRSGTGASDSGGRMSRRTWLGGAAIAGAAIGGGAIAGGGVAAASDGVSPRRERFVVDVACDGDTFRSVAFANRPQTNDNRGTSLAVEGWIYHEGHIPGDGFVVTSEGAIGHWFCAGYNIQHAERPEPHINAVATFVFGRISDGNLFPPDSLVASGLGGTDYPDVDSLRPLTGGSGKYFGVIGQVNRVNNGVNNTVLYGPGLPSPNFRYTFDLLYLV